MNRWRVLAAFLAAATVAAGVVGYRVGLADERDQPAAVLAGDGDGSDGGDAEQAARRAPTAGASFVDEGGRGAARAIVARTAADGTVLRVVEHRWEPGEGEEGPGWVPPPACRSVGNLEIGLVTPNQVAMGWAEVFDAEPAEPSLWGSGWVGYPQLGMVEFAAVRTTAPVRSVRLERDGAVVDEAEPVHGWAVVAAGGAGGGASTVVVVGAGGEELDRRPADRLDQPYDRAECQPPPPALPSQVRPAGEADAEATDAVTAAFTSAFARPGGDHTIDPRGHVAGDERLDDAFLEEVRESVSGLGIGAIDVEVATVGFIDDDTALAVFRLVGAPVGWTFGEAELVHGMWKASAQTWCSLVSRAGPQCPADLWDAGRGPARFDPYAGEGGR